MSVSVRPVMLRSFMLVVLVFVIVLAASSVAGCFDSTLEGYYHVDVSGLAGYTGDGSFLLLVPMPMWNGTPEYTAEDVHSGSLFFVLQVNGTSLADWEVDKTDWDMTKMGWSASTVDTEHGRMIAFTPNNDSNLSDFYDTILDDKQVSYSDTEQLVNETRSKPIMLSSDSPVVEGYSADNSTYTDKNNPTYTSYIYIGHGLSPAQGSADSDNIRIAVDYQLKVRENNGTTRAVANTFEAYIPPGASGWIPVTVYISNRAYSETTMF